MIYPSWKVEHFQKGQSCCSKEKEYYSFSILGLDTEEAAPWEDTRMITIHVSLSIDTYRVR